MKSVFFFAILALFALNSLDLLSQTPGGDKKPEYNDDTVYVFESPRPLISEDSKQLNEKAWGLDILLSESGFGLGFFWQMQVAENTIAFSNLYISGARRSDEFDEYDFTRNTFQVRNKINRLYKFPLMLGIQQFLFRGALSESLQPFLSFGAGPTFILSNPYTYDRIENGEVMGWFKSFNYSELYVRFGGFAGIGAYFGSINNNLLGINIRYYYIPFGGEGLESVKRLPIQNFGGLFITLTIGTAY